MNRLSPTLRAQGRLRPRTAILSGATLGLLAGAAVFGAVSGSSATASPTPLEPALVSSSTAEAAPAPCAKGQELEHGVCIVHVQRTVVIPAAGNGSSSSSDSSDSSGGSPSDSSSREASEHADEAAHEASEHADEAAEPENGDDS